MMFSIIISIIIILTVAILNARTAYRLRNKEQHLHEYCKELREYRKELREYHELLDDAYNKFIQSTHAR